MRIDLHVHSDASDGTRPPAEVMRRARGNGVDVVALTDHDTTAGWDAARAALPDGLTLVPGVELSCVHDGRSLHMLGYLFDPAEPVLAAELARIRDDRAGFTPAVSFIDLSDGSDTDTEPPQDGSLTVSRTTSSMPEKSAVDSEVSATSS